MPWKPLYTPSEREITDFRRRHSDLVRLLVDENAGSEVARFLEESFNTKYVAELGLLGKSDEDVFAAAWNEQRVIITHDVDFLDNRRFPPNRNPGIIRIGPGADGKDDEGLRRCLAIAMIIARKAATWWTGMKLDFSSLEYFTLYDGYNAKRRLRWLAHQPAEEWVDEE